MLGMIYDCLLPNDAAEHIFSGPYYMTRRCTQSQKSSDLIGFSKMASQTEMSKILKPRLVMAAGDVLHTQHVYW